jgi:hypothetical protein
MKWQNHDRGFYRVIGTLIIGVIIILLIAGLGGLSGCKVAEKAVTKYKASAAFPGDCADEFPVTFTPGKIDTIYGPTVDCDSLSAIFDAYWRQKNATGLAPDTVYIEGKAIATPAPPNKKVPCPPSTIQRDTVESTARLEQVLRLLSEAKTLHQNEVQLLKTQLAESESKRKRNGKQRNFLGGLVAVFALWSFRHQLLSLLTGPVAGGLTAFLGLFRRKK